MCCRLCYCCHGIHGCCGRRGHGLCRDKNSCYTAADTRTCSDTIHVTVIIAHGQWWYLLLQGMDTQWPASGRSWLSQTMQYRGRPWRYSVIPSTPDFPTEYQIRQHSNPAGLPTFAAIWGPDFRASIIRLTCPHVFKRITKITLMTMFKVNRGPQNEIGLR